MRAPLALLAFLLLAVPATAQVPTVCPAPTVAFSPSGVELQPGTETTLTYTVTNTAQVAANAQTAFTPPVGFAVDPPSADLGNIPAGGEAAVEVTVTALEGTAPETTGQLEAVTDLTCGQAPVTQSATAEAFADVTVVAAPANEVDNLLAYLSDPVVLAAVGLVLVGGLAAVALKGRRDGFGLACPEPVKPLRAGRGTSFPLEVTNRGAAVDTAVFSVSEVPDGWTAFTALPELQLGARETRTLWLMVRAPPGAPEGADARIVVRAASRGNPKREVEVALRAEVRENAPMAEA